MSTMWEEYMAILHFVSAQSLTRQILPIAIQAEIQTGTWNRVIDNES